VRGISAAGVTVKLEPEGKIFYFWDYE